MARLCPMVVSYGREVARQFRTRNDLIETQRTRSNADRNAAKSTKPTDIPPLITAWLQARVLPAHHASPLRASRGAATPGTVTAKLGRRSLNEAKAKTG